MRTDLDFDAVGEILREAAQTLICPRFRCLDQAAISTKSHDNDLVTVVDLETEEFLCRRLTALLPGSGAMGEESVYRDAARKKILDGPDPVWIVDPVDGTANYARGIPEFAIIVALAQRGRTLAGWIHDPLSGRLYVAERGSGVWRGWLPGPDRKPRRQGVGGDGRMSVPTSGGAVRRPFRGAAAQRQRRPRLIWRWRTDGWISASSACSIHGITRQGC
jgi:fructose-1,6-bisphosphatase/inositol monophosphatase family enzyme